MTPQTPLQNPPKTRDKARRIPWRRVLSYSALVSAFVAAWSWPESPVAELPPVSHFVRWSSHGDSLTALVRPAEGEWIVHQWETSTGRQTASFPLETSGLELKERPLVAVSPTAGHVALGRRPPFGDGSEPLRIWNVAQGTLWREFSICGGDYFLVTPLAFSGDGEWLAIQTSLGSEGPVIEIWRIGENRPHVQVSGCRAPIALSHDGQRLAAVDEQNHPCLIDSATGEVDARFDAHTFPVALLSFSRDGRLLASAANRPLSNQDSRPTEVALHDVDRQQTSRIWNLPHSLLAELSFEANDQCLCAREALASAASIWNLSEEIPEHPYQSLGNPVVAPDGWRQAVVTGDAENLLFAVVHTNPEIEIVDNRTGRTHQNVAGQWPHGSLVTPIAFSPDGKTLGVRVGRPRFSAWWLPFGQPRSESTERIWETWLVDSATGRTQQVFPGTPLSVAASNELFLAPNRLLLREGVGGEATVSARLWNSRPFPRRNILFIAAISSALALVWFRRKQPKQPASVPNSPAASDLTGVGPSNETFLR